MLAPASRAGAAAPGALPLCCATVTKLSAVSATLLRARTRATLAVLGIGATAIVAGCGSGGSSTITVGNENKTDQALATAGHPASTTPTTPTTTATTTPTSGPLATEPVVKPPSGAAPTKLESKDLIVGTGAEAKAGESLTVNYVGVLFQGGKEFDASWKRKEPFTFTLGQGQVIKGWDQGVAGMKVGGRRELVIPGPLAYPHGSGSIPANAPLVFVVDLLGA
jgi:peptidylprolyl isomerase